MEAFFLNDVGQYLELEFGPYGHYLVLLLDGVRVKVNVRIFLNIIVRITSKLHKPTFDIWICNGFIIFSDFGGIRRYIELNIC